MNKNNYITRTCGNHKVKCPYRTGKLCKKPKEFKCKDVRENWSKL